MRIIIKSDAFSLLQHISQPPCGGLDAEDVGQRRRRLLVSLLKAIEESNGGTLSHLEDPEGEGPLRQTLSDSAETGDVIYLYQKDQNFFLNRIISVTDIKSVESDLFVLWLILVPSEFNFFVCFKLLWLRSVVLLDLLRLQFSCLDSFTLLEHQNPP